MCLKVCYGMGLYMYMSDPETTRSLWMVGRSQAEERVV